MNYHYRNLEMSRKSFIQAIRDNDHLAFRLHTESGMFSEYDLQQAMTLAAFCGHDKMLQYFMDKKESDWSFLNPDIAMQASAVNGMAKGVMHLHRMGIDLHCDEDFPFYLALTHDRSVTSTYLVLNGVNAGDNDHALKTAHQRGKKNLVMDMLQMQALVDSPEKALAFAVQRDRPYIAMGAFLSGVSPNQEEGELFLKAIREGKESMVRTFLANGADVLCRGERIVFENAKNSKNVNILKMIHEALVETRHYPKVISACEARTSGMKTINEIPLPGEIVQKRSEPAKIIPIYRQHGRGLRQTTIPF